MRIAFVLFCFSCLTPLPAQEVRMLKSLSGGSGHVSGSKFVFDDHRTRFVYPRDKSLILYFEWAAPPGLHSISAVWKSPDGRPASIPTDIKIETKTAELTAYWVFDINASDASGIWTLDTRVDGAPAGSHNFELVVPAPVNKPPAPTEPRLPTTDEAYRATEPSLVLVHSLDAAGHRLDTSMGFVYAADRVATAFQSVDGASSIRVEFSDGSTSHVLGLAAFDRKQDWALLPVPTGSRAALKQASATNVKVGERALAFTIENEKTPVAAVVEVIGRGQGGAMATLRINPALPPISAGSPVLDAHAEVFGILGALATPGSRIPIPIASMNPTAWERAGNTLAVTPIATLKPGGQSMTLEQLTTSGVFTPPLERFPCLIYATTTDVGTKRGDLPDRNVTEFSRRVPAIWLVSLWERREKAKNAVVTAAIFDGKNQKRGESQAKKVSFGDTPYRLANSIPMATLEPGSYRVDVLADGVPVWRTFIRVIE